MLKIKHMNDKRVSKMQNGEMAYLRHGPIAEPHGDAPKCPYRVHRPIHQCNHIKIAPINISQTLEDEMAYLGCDLIVQPYGSPLQSKE